MLLEAEESRSKGEPPCRASLPVVLIDGWRLSDRSWEHRSGCARCRIAGDHVRPERLRRLEQARLRLRLRHLRPGFGQAHDEARPARRHAGRLLDGRRRGGLLSGKVRFHAREPRGLHGGGAPVPAENADNPTGVDGSVFEGIKKAIAADRPASLSKFFADFFNVDVLGGTKISDEVVRLSRNVGALASPRGTLECVSTWVTDLRKGPLAHQCTDADCARGCGPDYTLAATGTPTHEAIQGRRLPVVKGGPHGLNWTYAVEVNRELVNFLGQAQAAQT